MSDTKVLALVLLTVFSAFIFQWAYFSSVNSDGELIWAPDIKIEEPEALEEPEEPEEPEKIKGPITYEMPEFEEPEGPGFWASIFPELAEVWGWFKQSHMLDIVTFNIWNVNTPVPKGIQYAFSMVMGIIIYAIPAYLIAKLIRGGG